MAPTITGLLMDKQQVMARSLIDRRQRNREVPSVESKAAFHPCSYGSSHNIIKGPNESLYRVNHVVLPAD